jgi:DNA end-binding protein Ku
MLHRDEAPAVARAGSLPRALQSPVPINHPKRRTMAMRTSWEGYLKLNLLSVPVKAFSATVAGGGKIHFHLIHSKCNSRIHYEKFCPIHGEVPNDEVVSGYEFAKNQFVIVKPEELDKLLPENDRAIDIDVFIHRDDLDPIYYGGASYYLVPDGPVAEKPYTVLQRVMAETKRYAIAQLVFSGQGRVVLVRPVENLLVMSMLHFDEQIQRPSAFVGELKAVAVKDQELKLAETLVEASTAKRFDFSHYADEYTGKLTKLLEARAAGKKVVPARGSGEPAVINLMDALRQSLVRAQRERPSKNGLVAKKPKTKRNDTAHRSRRVASR